MKFSPILTRAVAFAVILVGAVFVGYRILDQPAPLPILRPVDLNPDLVDESIRNRTKHRIGSFILTDQRGRTITEKDVEGKVYLVDFFFTTCEGICKDMSRNMARIQFEFSDGPDLLLLSHSVTPKIDSTEALLAYGELYGAHNDRWLLLTGDKQHIYELARKHYFAATSEGDGGPEDMVHTENFVLIDKEKRIRGFYDGTSDEDIDRAISDIRILLAEYDQ